MQIDDVCAEKWHISVLYGEEKRLREVLENQRRKREKGLIEQRVREGGMGSTLQVSIVGFAYILCEGGDGCREKDVLSL